MKKIPTLDVHDIEVCLKCHQMCHFSSGRFVNRYSGYLELDNAVIEGWICGDCCAKQEAEWDKWDKEVS